MIAAIKDFQLPEVTDDPRITKDGRKLAKVHGGGRNTESFDPKSTIVRPDMRIIVEKPAEKIKRVLKHDVSPANYICVLCPKFNLHTQDVVVVPDFFCEEDDWSIYYKLIEEMRELQSSKVRDSDWISWLNHLPVRFPV